MIITYMCTQTHMRMCVRVYNTALKKFRFLECLSQPALSSAASSLPRSQR